MQNNDGTKTLSHQNKMKNCAKIIVCQRHSLLTIWWLKSEKKFSFFDGFAHKTRARIKWFTHFLFLNWSWNWIGNWHKTDCNSLNHSLRLFSLIANCWGIVLDSQGVMIFNDGLNFETQCNMNAEKHTSHRYSAFAFSTVIVKYFSNYSYLKAFKMRNHYAKYINVAQNCVI